VASTIDSLSCQKKILHWVNFTKKVAPNLRIMANNTMALDAENTDNFYISIGNIVNIVHELAESDKRLSQRIQMITMDLHLTCVELGNGDSGPIGNSLDAILLFITERNIFSSIPSITEIQSVEEFIMSLIEDLYDQKYPNAFKKMSLMKLKSKSSKLIYSLLNNNADMVI